MLIKNTPHGPVNGTMGIVKGLMTKEEWRDIAGAAEAIWDIMTEEEEAKVFRKQPDGGAGEEHISLQRTDPLLPVVLFTVIGADPTPRSVVMLVQPHTFKIENVTPTGTELVASRKQVRSLLDYRYSIHGFLTVTLGSGMGDYDP